MEKKREIKASFLYVATFLALWSSAAGLLSPKGVNFEGN